MRNLITLALLLAPQLVQAQRLTVPLGTLLDDVAMNAGAAALTFYIGRKVDCGRNNSCAPTSATDTSEGAYIRDFSRVRLELNYTHANDGAITLTCTEGAARATATGTISTATLASGTYTLSWSGVVVTPSLTASRIFPVKFRTFGAPVIKCVVSHGGTPGASDRITVTGQIVKE